jgi:hypothetical protein
MPTLRETSPAQTWAAVTPDDTDNLSAPARGLYVGGAGDVAAVGLDGVAVTFVGVAAGTILPIAAKRVNETGTTATDIVALY